ncbi:MAG: ATP:cob(I)alamin adenosyltransferase, partial [Verrucomicrobia bacterium]|nr:ATP:cob(I)alamin adenosyltransferase [Verrucomicrobiota bacterium]
LGWAKAVAAGKPDLINQLEAVQRDLVNLMGELSADDADAARYLDSRFGRVTADDLARLDAGIAALENGDPPLKFDGWATPGKNALAASLDLARVAARRAERQLVALQRAGSPVRDLPLRYINRVSDLLWLLARQAES